MTNIDISNFDKELRIKLIDLSANTDTTFNKLIQIILTEYFNEHKVEDVNIKLIDDKIKRLTDNKLCIQKYKQF